MASIAIIDDRPDQSETVKLNIELELENLGSDLGVIQTLPFKKFDQYFGFIDKNDVHVIILDERLNDAPVDEFGTVGYKGSELIVELRKKLKEFPIFTLTVIPTDAELLDKQNQYEQIISREEFYKHAEKYVPIFLRAAKTYLNDHLGELSDFNKLTQLAANGKASQEDVEKLKAIQVKLDLPMANFDDRKVWLDEYDKHISALEDLNKRIKEKLEGRV